MYIVFIVLIAIAALLLIFAVLAQNPKGGMAANFGASNQVMGARQSANFLEKSTWVLATSILLLSLLASIAMGGHRSNVNSDEIADQITAEQQPEATIPNQTEEPTMLPLGDIQDAPTEPPAE